MCLCSTLFVAVHSLETLNQRVGGSSPPRLICNQRLKRPSSDGLFSSALLFAPSLQAQCTENRSTPVRRVESTRAVSESQLIKWNSADNEASDRWTSTDPGLPPPKLQRKHAGGCSPIDRPATLSNINRVPPHGQEATAVVRTPVSETFS